MWLSDILKYLIFWKWKHFQKTPNPSSSISVAKNPRSSQNLHTSAYEIFDILGESIEALDTCSIPIPGIYLPEHNTEK